MCKLFKRHFSTNRHTRAREMSSWALFLALILTDTHLLAPVASSSDSSNVQYSAPTDSHHNHTISLQQARASWRWLYIDEEAPKFEVLVREPSIDERFANLVYTSHVARVVNLDSFKTNQGDPEHNRKLIDAMAGADVDEQQCGQDIAAIIELAEELGQVVASKRQQSDSPHQWQAMQENHIRLARVLDSFGRYESSGLSGKWHYGGSVRQCESTHLLLGPNQRRVETRMCTARLSLNKHLNASLKTRPLHLAESEPAIFVSVCLPRSCHSGSATSETLNLLSSLISSQFKLPEQLYVHQSLELESVFCTADPDSPAARWPASAKIFLTVVSSWIALVAYVTWNRCNGQLFSWLPTRWAGNLQNSLDAVSSWEELINAGNPTKTPRPPGRVNLDVMNPIKVLGCAYVIAGHALMVYAALNNNLPQAYWGIENNPVTFVMLAGTMVVDTFFVITGILIAYVASSRIKPPTKQSLFHWLTIQSFSMFIFRYLRLVPLYALMFWFKKSLLMRLGWGPLWDAGQNSATLYGSCHQDPWWTPLTFMGAYRPLARQCLPHAWSVSADIFFCLFLAPIMVLVTFKPLLAGLISVLVSVAGIAAWLGDMSGLAQHLRSDLISMRSHAIAVAFTQNSFIYTSPHYRVCAVLIGVSAGAALYRYSQTTANRDKKPKSWPKWFTGPATKVSSVSILLLFIIAATGPYMKKTELNWNMSDSVLNQTVVNSRVCFCLASAVILLRMMSDWKDEYIMKLFAGSFWKTMSKLNYAILLIHMDVLIIDIQLYQNLPTYSSYQIFKSSLASYLLCCIAAVPIFVLIENPLDKLIKSFLLVRCKSNDCPVVTKDASESRKQLLTDANDSSRKDV